MSPTQAQILEHMERADCPLQWWQALYGIRRARFDSIRALFMAGFIVRHPGWSGPSDQLKDCYLMVSAAGIVALAKLRSQGGPDSALHRITAAGRQALAEHELPKGRVERA